MKSSESIKNIAKALCGLQSVVQDAHKAKQGHNYSYADLSQVLFIARATLPNHGLAVVQFPCSSDGQVGVTTRLMHESGEWMEDTLYVDVQAGRGMSLAQAAGSVITYCRRYSLAAVIGITQTDDDGFVEGAESVGITEYQLVKVNDLIESGAIKVEHIEARFGKSDPADLTQQEAARIISKTKRKAA